MKIRMARMAKWCSRIFFQTIFVFSILPLCFASDLTLLRTPSTGYQPQFQVSGNKIYYVWHEYDGPFRQIFTAEMNVDGTGWNATKRTSTSFDKFEPQLQVVEDKIYFVWRESDGAHYQIWTGLMNRDETGWQAFKRTTTPFDKHNPQLEVQGGKIYLTWHEADRPDLKKARYQIWTASMKMDGTVWQAIQRTNTPFDKYTPQLQVVGDKIYYVWEESDGKYRQIWTAAADKDGTGWRGEKRTRSPYGKYDPQFQLVGNKTYYVWHENHGSAEPIWVAVETMTE